YPYDRHCCPRATPRGRAALPLQERPPLQAVALAAGLPHAASQWAAALCRLAVGLPFAAWPQGCPLWPRNGQPPPASWPWALPMLAGAAPARSSHARGRSHLLAANPAKGFGRGRSPPYKAPWV
ncbi:hypothetical protein BHE74_00057121, partial [Ensete ventricosum]